MHRDAVWEKNAFLLRVSLSSGILSVRRQCCNMASASDIPNGLDGGGQSGPDVSREDILKQIFGDIGKLVEGQRALLRSSCLFYPLHPTDFTCAVESTVLLHGRMYITSKFICFYSNLFGLEKKIRIPYSHIKNITKENTAMVIPNAIAISTGAPAARNSLCFLTLPPRQEGLHLSLLLGQRGVLQASDLLLGAISWWIEHGFPPHVLTAGHDQRSKPSAAAD